MNTANKLTILRVFLIPVFIIFAMANQTAAQIIALAVFIIASLTDFLDGYIARKYNLVSDFGKFLDPLADKLLVTAALCVLVARSGISVWILFIITVREFIVTGLRLIAASKGVVIAASKWGKLKTMIQLIAIPVALMPNFGQYNPIIWEVSAVTAVMWLAAAVTVVSGVDYIIKNIELIKYDK